MKSGFSKKLMIFARMKSLFLFYILLIGILYLLHSSPWGNLIHPQIRYIMAFLIFQSYLTIGISQISPKSGKEKFVHFQLINLTIRFISSLSFIGFFAYTGTPEIFLFAINFFVLYLCSANFEIIALLRNLRRF